VIRGTGMWIWAIFGLGVAVAVALDLGVFHRRARRISLPLALLETSAWIALALAFNGWIYFSRGHEAGLQFLTGYIVEKSLSIDNIFVFVVIFRALGVPVESQHRVLYSGVIGALVMRAAFVLAGVQLLQHFRPVVFLFGAILLFTGGRMLMPGAREISPEKNWLVRLVRRVARVTNDFRGDRFWVKEGGGWNATPLFLALIAVEAMDIIFAVDSVPAVLAITRDSFIAYSSNVFAILGLRAMYFALADVLPRIRFLHAGLAAILIFVGGKMVIGERWPISTDVSLAVIAGIAAVTLAASFLSKKREE